MSPTARDLAIETFVSMLGNLSHVLGKGAEHVEAKGLAPAALAEARLAPDMFTLRQQVQLACFHARDATARLTGQEPPAHERVDEALDELEARIQSTIESLRRLPAGAFDGAEDREIVIPLPDGMAFEMKGYQLLRDWSLPHFYFHVVTAYDILRHEGVDIGKRDYLVSAGRYLRRGEGSTAS